MARRVGLIHPKGSMDTLPCLTSAVTLLVRSGYGVNVFIVPEKRCRLPDFGTGDIRVHALHRYDRGAAALLGIRNLMAWVLDILRVCHREPPVALIGVDPLGLLMASLAAGILRIPVVYYSLEVLVSSEIKKRRWHFLKLAERLCNRRAAFTIIQDSDRAALLAAENRIPISQIVCVPNSPLGKAELIRTRYLRDKLGISDEKRIILVVGSLTSWTLSLELAQCAQDWPEDWVLVLHTRQHLGDDIYGREIRNRADGRHIFLSTEQVSFNRLADSIASADIGIALYRPTYDSPERGANLIHMGLSSGKIAGYLQVGLPVIGSDMPTLKYLFEMYQCGVVVPDADAVGTAIRQILDNYDAYAENAIRCYQDQFDCESKFDEVLARLALLSRRIHQ